MKIIWQHKKIMRQNKNREIPSLKEAKVDLVQCNLLDNQCQHKSEVLYTTRYYNYIHGVLRTIYNKSYAYLLIVEPINLVILKTYET